MKKNYYWKVVRVTPILGTYKSSFIRQGKYCLYYKVGIPTKSAMSENGIFVFETRKQARSFSKNFCKKTFRIFKCKIHGPEVKNPIFYDTWNLMFTDKKSTGHYSSFPNGTRSFPSITLIE